MPTNPREIEVAVIGGGLAGLSAAVSLASSGVEVELFERSSQLGGRAASRLVGDYVLDLGPHALYANGAARKGLENLGVAIRGHAPSPRAAAKLAGRYYQLPMGPASLLTTRLLGVADKLRLGKLLSELQSPKFASRAAALPPELTVSRWITGELPPGNGRILLETLIRLSCYSGHPAQRASVALGQLHLAVTGGVLYLDGGWRSLVEPLEQKLAATGRIKHGNKVTELRPLDDAPQSRWAVAFANGQRVCARHVVLAVAPNIARKLLERGGTGTLKALAALAKVSQADASHASCLQVALDPVASGKYDFILGLDEPVYFSAFSATAQVGPNGAEVIHLMRYLDQSEPREGTRGELESLLDFARPGWRERVTEARYQPHLCVTNWIETSQCPRPRSELAPGLFAAGDWIAADGILADAAVGSAMDAASRILQQRATAQPHPASMFATTRGASELWS
ncbi:MAG: FAD-dependent oxidoreductase [Polyangiaceae bacterium]|nr:FAD-dependent oxidoreductase [Myxococcales bacterium]MCB9584774.1 FAD-dependent oxidoreductase [Polyangiaceae bacterium]MCB9607653.1 FAD-dependent oxidoreductase [Polyangiaceae bacterium]